MGSFGVESELAQTLVEAGNSLLNPPPSTDGLLSLLDEIESLLSNVEQDPPVSMQDALLPSMKALISVDLLRHPDPDVRVSVVSCLTEITRITAPEAPYDDEQMKEIFQLTVEAFGKLADLSCRSYKKAELILDTVSKVRSCLVMLDLECDKLILEMFQELLKVISPEHPQAVLLAIEMIMITAIDESEEVSTDLLDILLARVRKENESTSPVSWKLVEKVLGRCARKLKPYITEALKSNGNGLDMYSPVILSICHGESVTKERKSNHAKETETLDLGLSRKRIRSGNVSRHLDDSSKQAVRNGTSRTNENDKRTVSIPSLLKVEQSFKQGQPESTDAETDSGTTMRKRGRKPNSLRNQEEGYDHVRVSEGKNASKMPSSKKLRKRGLESSSLENLDAKKTSFPKETTSLPSKAGQTTQSVVISLPSPCILRGPRKRSRVRREKIDQDKSSFPSPTGKKETSSIQVKKKGSLSPHTSMKTESCDEEYPMTSNQVGCERPEDGRKTAKSSKKAMLQNRLEKTTMKKPFTGAKMVKTCGKGLVIRSDAKKKGTEDSTPDGVVPRSSKSKKMDSQVATRPLAEGPEETPKSHPKKKRTARKEMDTETPSHGEGLVGKKIKVWWPLDKTFYEGIISSYDNGKKKHLVLYSDGEKEMLNLKKQRWEFVEDITLAKGAQETDLPESMTLSGILQRQKAHKNKNASTSVTTTSSSEIRSSKKTLKKKDAEREFKKQAKRVKDKAIKKSASASEAESEERPITREGKNLKSLKELNAEPHQAEAGADRKRKVTPVMPRENEEDCHEDREPRTKGEVNRKSRKDPNAETIAKEEIPESEKETNAETVTDGEKLKSLKEANSDGSEAMTEAKKQEHDEETCTSMSENGKQEYRHHPKSEKEQNAESGEREGVTSSDPSPPV